MLKIDYYAPAVAIALCFGVLHSKASDIEQGVGVVCDHATEVKRFIQVYQG